MEIGAVQQRIAARLKEMRLKAFDEMLGGTGTGGALVQSDAYLLDARKLGAATRIKELIYDEWETGNIDLSPDARAGA